MGKKYVSQNVLVIVLITVLISICAYQTGMAASYTNFNNFDNYTTAETGSTSYFGFGGGGGGTISMDTTVNHGSSSGKSIKWYNRFGDGKSKTQRVKFFKAFEGLDTTTVGVKYDISLWVKTGAPVNGSATTGYFNISVLHTADTFSNLVTDPANYKVTCTNTDWTLVKFPYTVTSTQQPLLGITVEQVCIGAYTDLVDVVYFDDLRVSAQGSVTISPDGKTKAYTFDEDTLVGQSNATAGGGLPASSLSLDSANYRGTTGKSLKVSGCATGGNRVRFLTPLEGMINDNHKKYKISMYVKIDPTTTGSITGTVRPGFEYMQGSYNYGDAFTITTAEWTEVTIITGLHSTAPYAISLTVMGAVLPKDFLVDDVTITNIEISSSPDIAGAEITFTDGTNSITSLENNTTVLAKAAISNYMRLENQKPILVAALYGSDNMLKKAVTTPMLLSLNHTGDMYPTILTATLTELTPVDGDTVKAFVWDGLDTMQPNTQAELLPYHISQITDLDISPMFGDDMVLQQKVKIPVWGTAITGSRINVSFAGQTINTVAQDNKWNVEFEPVDAGGPYEMEIQTDDRNVTFNNVMVGEVWFCSGQSNMLFRVNELVNATEELANANLPNVRFFRQEGKASVYPISDPASGTWQVCTPQTVGTLSAVGYLFAKELAADMNVPVGIVQAAVGGSYIEAWTKRDPTVTLTTQQMALFGGNTVVPSTTALNNVPGVYYDAMISPIMPYAIKGVLWYQGESNSGNGDYDQKMVKLIGEWRSTWKQGTFPFLYVQLPRYGLSSWTHTLRDQQLKVLSQIDNTGMAISIDTGEFDNVHPTDKAPIANRLVLLARALAYGKEDQEYSGPLYKGYSIEGNKVTIEFTHTGTGLVITDNIAKGFVICGSDKVFKTANARVIASNKIEVWSDEILSPAAVRYAFSVYPEISLYNQESLPASPFRTDTYNLFQ